MASGIDKQKSSDVTVCSICFEKFRTPRILPCTHVFCHGCISSYIVTSCQSKEAPVGFSCPLCREFVPSPSIPCKPENWADCFPVCKMLEKLNKEDDTYLCAACLRENEEEDATEFCMTCEESICGTCAKYHKRILTTRYHLVCTLTDPNLAMQLINMSLDTGNCPEHPDKEIELYCNDHLKVCCSLCSNTEHRKCGDVTTIQSRVQRIKEEGNVQKLLQKIRIFEQELVSIKQTQEQNITKLDSTTDRIMEETKNIRKSINECLDKLEKEHLEEIGGLSKNSRNILNKTIDSLSDRIQFSRQCTKSLEDINCKTNTCFVKKYNEIKEGYENLERQTMHLKIHDIKIESKLAQDLFRVAKMTCLSKNKVLHTQREFARRGSYLNDAEVMRSKNSIYEADKLENYVKERDYFKTPAGKTTTYGNCVAELAGKTATYGDCLSEFAGKTTTYGDCVSECAGKTATYGDCVKECAGKTTTYMDFVKELPSKSAYCDKESGTETTTISSCVKEPASKPTTYRDCFNQCASKPSWYRGGVKESLQNTIFTNGDSVKKSGTETATVSSCVSEPARKTTSYKDCVKECVSETTTYRD